MRVGLLLVDGVADSGLALIQDVFVAANLLAGRVDRHIAEFDVSLRATGEHVDTSYGLRVTTRPLAELRDEPADVLIAPSLGLVSVDEILRAVGSQQAADLLPVLREHGGALAAACSGTFFLAEAGLLAGREATTSWWLGPSFRARYPAVHLDETEALVVSDTVTTAGAALAHLDLALSIVRGVSPALADLVADYLAVGDRPRQGDVMRTGFLSISDPVLSAFDRAVRDGLSGPLDIARLAGQLGVSQRTLQRLTSHVLGMSPVRYIQQVRLEHAIDLLVTTDLGLAAVARAVGYQDATTLTTLIRRRRGTTPEQLRRRRRWSPAEVVAEVSTGVAGRPVARRGNARRTTP
ncbi:GlxA family transcriptional regulator [uncultured Jatrophihabitans sp.]|uniref:GlxA family transcriptional regulator n=1 Tax=uncultured Jatrophihabitans sp. TaxID=1610747 RepID=UPI0035CAAF0F